MKTTTYASKFDFLVFPNDTVFCFFIYKARHENENENENSKINEIIKSHAPVVLSILP